MRKRTPSVGSGIKARSRGGRSAGRVLSNKGNILPGQPKFDKPGAPPKTKTQRKVAKKAPVNSRPKVGTKRK